MSLPNIPDITPNIDLDRDEAITLLLASIAMEEMGLAHILNAEGEKLQYILSLKSNKDTCLHEILAVNESIERVIKSVTRLQLILQDKLESVVRLIPKGCEPHPRPPRPPKPKPCCYLAGSGVGCVQNKDDDFYGATATLEALVKCDEASEGHYPIQYNLFKRGKGTNMSAVLVPIQAGLDIHCPKLNSCPRPEKPNLLVMKGKAIMCIKGNCYGQQQANVHFTLRVWDYGVRRQFQMVTRADHQGEFTHDSGLVEVTQGELRIENCDCT